MFIPNNVQSFGFKVQIAAELAKAQKRLYNEQAAKTEIFL